MAKKTKKPKHTAEENERLEQRFHQVRNQALREWYEQARGEDPELRTSAQARLQLQIWLRERRREITTRKQERDACKADGDTNGWDTARKKLKHAQYGLVMNTNMSREGIPVSTAMKACRKWNEKTYTLEEILDDLDLDKRNEFGVTHDNTFDPVADEEKDGGMLLDGGSGNSQSEHGDVGTTFDHGNEASDSSEPMADPTSIWEQHAVYMQQRYQCANLPDFAVETKLAFQKKIFDEHLDRERQLCKATESALGLNANSQYPIREGISTSWSPVLVTTTFAEHSLWELTSSLLWRYFEGGLSWDYPQWVPRGVMRIQTVSNSSHIYFDFGVRTFSTQRISIPATVSTQTLTFTAQCHQTGANINFDIAFLAQGFVKVQFPALTVVQPDLGCRSLPVTPIELTGMWMGPVE